MSGHRLPGGGKKYFRRRGARSSIDALIPLVPQMSPANPVCISPYAERLILLWIRSDAQDVPVEVFDLHLQCPLEIVGRVPDSCAGRHVVCVQCADILHADPHPHAPLALVVIGQEDGALISRNAGKSVACLPSQFEAKSVQVVGDAGFHVLDAKDWQRWTEAVR